MNLQAIRALDAADPLASRREAFLLPEDMVYLNGNSLGPLTRSAQSRLIELERQWGQDLISSWNRHHWIDLPQRVGHKISRLIGASPRNVICCDSVSVNLFKLLAAALQLQPGDGRVLSLESNFPTDLYSAQGLQALLGAERCQLQLVAQNELEAALRTGPAVLLLTQVDFRDCRKLDIAQLTALAHGAGTLVIWDLSHSVGVLPLSLDQWRVDFAVGCGYKYLNGGPGAPAFLYVAERHQQSSSNALSGWMGHREPFAFTPQWQAGAGIDRFLSGTPAVLSMSCLDAALDAFADIEPRQLWDKSMQLSQLFLDLLAHSVDLEQLQLSSPGDPLDRGGHLAFAHPQAFGLCQALATAGVQCDFRSPDLLRIGFSPLFLRFEDIWQAARRLQAIVATGEHLLPQHQIRAKVT